MSEPSRYRWKLTTPFGSTYWLPAIVVCALAAFWYGAAGAAGAREALPWLLLALGSSWICGPLANSASGPYRWIPRSTKLRRAVESSLFWSRVAASPSGDLGNLRLHLRHAMSAASNPPMRARLRTLAEQMNQPGAARWDQIGAELSSMLHELAGARRKGPEREFIATTLEFAWIVAFLAACGALAARLGSFPRVPVVASDLAVALTAAAVAYPFAKLFLLARYKIGIVRLHARRTVFSRISRGPSCRPPRWSISPGSLSSSPFSSAGRARSCSR